MGAEDDILGRAFDDLEARYLGNAAPGNARSRHRSRGQRDATSGDSDVQIYHDRRRDASNSQQRPPPSPPEGQLAS